MAFIFDGGTGRAAPTSAWGAGRMILMIAAPLLLAAEAPADHRSGTIDVTISGLRSHKGLVRACLTRNPHFFPQCDKDPESQKASVAAVTDTRLSFTHVAAGDYAITVLHDENSNARADMFLGIPREGIGFSQNPRIRFGPPKFAAARFRFDAGEISKPITLQYFL